MYNPNVALPSCAVYLLPFIACNNVHQEKTGLEAQHRNKINAEINRYQAMVQEKEELSRKWDEQVLQRKRAENPAAFFLLSWPSRVWIIFLCERVFDGDVFVVSLSTTNHFA